MTDTFLVELGTEELPPKALSRLATAFRDSVVAGLSEARLTHGEAQWYATPRRLAVLVKDLSTEQPSREVEKRGPPVKVAFDENGEPTRAATAFADGLGVSVADLDRISTDKGEWLAYTGTEEGQPAAELLPEIVEQALSALPIPRRMRWGSSDAEFVRPAHWLVMMLGKTVIPATILDQAAGDKTRGHRFHAPDPITLKHADDYVTVLETDGRVLPDFGRRRARIAELSEAAAARAGGTAVMHDEVLDEVTALVEWPVAVTGSIDEEFLELPDEVLISSMQDHQRYFPMLDSEGKLKAGFITISNIDSADPSQVQLGNERVVRPRLADAAFFWQQDTQRTLESRVADLDNVVFQRGLGTLREKSARVAELSASLAATTGADSGDVARAAELAKTDLLTDMVGEFPDLQGRMGYHYALKDGEPEAVAVAIEEQYLPRFAGDRLPATAEGRALGLAERLDTLAGIFCLGKRPSGNKDPFGLRRTALGLVRILIEGGIDADLPALVETAVGLQPAGQDKAAEHQSALEDFISDRLRAWYLDGQAPGFEAGSVTAEMFDAVRERRPASPLDFNARLGAVAAFMQLDAAESLAAANKRIANILKKSAVADTGAVDPAKLTDEAEKTLYAEVEARRDPHQKRLAELDYSAILEDLAGLRGAVDSFFDDVMVNAEDEALRNNRLALLTELRGMFLDVADLSRIST